MTSARVTESVVEEAALGWLVNAGWPIRHGAVIAPGEPAAGRDDFGHLVPSQRLRGTLLPQLISGVQRLPVTLRHRPAQEGVKDRERILGRHP